MATFNVTESITTIQCANCAITFGVPSRFESDRRNDHKSFYCPQGHSQSFSSESDEERFRRERDRALQKVAQIEDEKREAIAAAEREKKKLVAETKRLKKRAAAGTCPCCQRSFSNMTEHMKKQHPKFVAEETSNVVAMKASK